MGRRRETRAERKEREEQERVAEIIRAEEDRLAIVGAARVSGLVHLWGPDEQGRFLAGAECSACAEDVIGRWVRAGEDGPTRRSRNDPHRDAARRSLFVAAARHECVRSEEIPAETKKEETPEEARARKIVAIDALISGATTPGERAAAVAARERILSGGEA